MNTTIPSKIKIVTKKWLFSFLLFTVCLNASAQNSQTAKDSAIAEIKQLTVEWNNAIINRDSANLEKILASEYTLYTLNGSAKRNQWLANVKRYTTDSLLFVNDMHITYYGGAVKVEGILYWKRAWDTKPVVSNHSLITDIWVKRDGRWQVLIRMAETIKRSK